MNIKKVFVGLALMVPMVFAPEAFAQGCGQSNWQQSGWNNQGNWNQNGWNNQNGWQGRNHQQRKMQRKMQRRMAKRWQQRQLAANDPYFNYWNSHPSEYQALWRSQAEMDSLMGNGIISASDRALLDAQMAAYQQQQNLIASGQMPFYGQDPLAMANYPGGNGLVGNLLGGGNAYGNPYINGALPGLLQRLAGYWAQNQGLGLAQQGLGF